MFIELILVVLSIAMLLQYFHFRSKPPGTPPGTVGYPIIGVVPPSDCSFDEHLNRCRKKYGDTFWLKIGSRNLVTMCDYEEILIAFNNPALQGRPHDFLSINMIHPGKEKGIVFTHGSNWRLNRHFAIRGLRDGGMGKSSMEAIVIKESEALADDMGKHVGKPIELPLSINCSTLNIVSHSVFDHRFEMDDPEILKLHATYADFMLNLQENGIFWLDFLPWIANWAPEFVQNLFGKDVFQQKLDKIYKPINKFVEEHKKTLDEDYSRDFTDAYLNKVKKLARDEKYDAEMSTAFTDKYLPSVIFDLFLGGGETTSTVMRWYLLLMAKYPNIQKRVQEELDNVVSRNNTLGMEDQKNLPYLEATINETLRLKPVFPVSTFRVALEDTKINNYFIPKGTLLMANVLSCNKSTYWEKPEEFYPEHFLNADQTINYKKRSFLTFLTGPRACLGENIGRMTLFLTLGTLMQRFTFTAPPGAVMSLDQVPEQPYVTVPPPFKLIVNKR